MNGKDKIYQVTYYLIKNGHTEKFIRSFFDRAVRDKVYFDIIIKYPLSLFGMPILTTKEV